MLRKREREREKFLTMTDQQSFVPESDLSNLPRQSTKKSFNGRKISRSGFEERTFEIIVTRLIVRNFSMRQQVKHYIYERWVFQAVEELISGSKLQSSLIESITVSMLRIFVSFVYRLLQIYATRLVSLQDWKFSIHTRAILDAVFYSIRNPINLESNMPIIDIRRIRIANDFLIVRTIVPDVFFRFWDTRQRSVQVL